MGKVIWVIAEDLGCEGLREPFMAFLDKSVAEQAMDLLCKPLAGTSARLIEVPVWDTAGRAALQDDGET